jgi:hypothetical protein
MVHSRSESMLHKNGRHGASGATHSLFDSGLGTDVGTGSEKASFRFAGAGFGGIIGPGNHHVGGVGLDPAEEGREEISVPVRVQER